MPKDYKLFSSIILFIVLLVLLYITLSWSWASISTQRVEVDLARWESDIDSFDKNLAKKYIERTNFAIKLNAYNPSFYLLKIRLINLINSASQEQFSNKYIDNLYRTAIGLTPTSDLLWAKHATFSNSNKDIKQTLISTETAIALGKYESDSMELIVPIIFEHWEEISNRGKLRVACEELIWWLLEFNDKNTLLVIEWAAKFEQLELLRKHAQHPWIINRYNNLVEKQSKSQGDSNAK